MRHILLFSTVMIGALAMIPVAADARGGGSGFRAAEAVSVEAASVGAAVVSAAAERALRAERSVGVAPP